MKNYTYYLKYLCVITLISICAIAFSTQTAFAQDATASNLQLFYFKKTNSDPARADTYVRGAYAFANFSGQVFEMEFDQYNVAGANVQEDKVVAYSNYMISDWKWTLGFHLADTLPGRANSKAVFLGTRYMKKNRWGYATWHVGLDASATRDSSSANHFTSIQLSPYARVYRPGFRKSHYLYYDARIYMQELSTTVLNEDIGRAFELGFAYSAKKWLFEASLIPESTTVNLLTGEGFVLNSELVFGLKAKQYWSIAQTYNFSKSLYIKGKYSKQYLEDALGLRSDVSSVGVYLGYNF